MQHIPVRLTAGAAALVGAVNRIQVDPSCPTLGTAVDQKTGDVLLVLGKAYLDAADDVKSVMLEHEACHVAMKCTERYIDHVHKGTMPDEHSAEEKRRQQTWNVAHDAVIHHRCIDPTKVLEVVGGITFEKLELTPRSCEATYDALMEKSEQQSGCGRSDNMVQLPDWFAAEVAAEIAREYGNGYGSNANTRLFGPAQPPPPDWARMLEAWLRKSVKRGRSRRRSWLQVSRRNPFLPGMVHLRGESALVLVDVSGSIDDSTVNMVCGLVSRYAKALDVVWWADYASDRMPARQALATRKESCVGGGTNPHPAAALRRAGEPVIWITDSQVPSWPKFTPMDLVMTSGEAAPAPATSVRL